MIKKLLFVSAFIGTFFTSFSQLSNGLVSDFPFTYGGRFNYKFSNQHATIIDASPTSDRFGNDNMALEFDGIDDYLLVPHNLNFDLDYMNGVSISVWVNPTTISSNLSAIVAKWNGSTSEQYGLFVDNGNPFVAVRSVSNSGISDATTTLTTGTWYHLVFTYDRTTNEHKIYVNNVNTLTQTTGGTYLNTTEITSLSFGAQASDLNNGVPSPTRFFNGKIDDIKIYNRVLTNVEIDSLYNMPNPLCNNFSVNVSNIIDATSGSNNDGSFTFIPTGGFAPYTYTINSSGSSSITSNTMCVTTGEGGTVSFTAPGTALFTHIDFSSYGTANGNCNDFTYGDCHSMTSYSAITSQVVGLNSILYNTNNTTFGDPCFGTGKQYNAQFSYAESVTISNLAPGTYNVEITDSIGCTTMETVTISNTTGILESNLNTLSIYPNPTNGILNVTSNYNTSILVLDVTGKVLFSETINGSKTIDVSSLAKGIYFIKEGSSNTIKKFIKE